MEIEKTNNKYHQAILWLVAGLLIISFLGFRKSYFQVLPGFRGGLWVIHFHVISILCWLAMLGTQALLAKKRLFEMHRKLGRLSYPLAALIVIGFALVTSYGQLKNKAPALLGATIFDGSMFVLFYTLAILYKRNLHYHASYMMLSAVPFINPGLGRFIAPEVSLPVEFLLILFLLLNAFFRKKPYRPYVVALGSFILILAVVVYISFVEPTIIQGLWDVIWGTNGRE